MKTRLDYKAIDATRDERLARIAEALARAAAQGHQSVPGRVSLLLTPQAKD